MKRTVASLVSILLPTATLLAAVAAGERRVGDPGRESRGPGAEQKIEGSAGGIRWTAPASWQVGSPQPMRVASYTIPAAPNAEAGSCGVFYFGKGQGGTVDDNLVRWAGQFEGGSTPKKGEMTVAGMKVHTIAVAGTYLSPSGPSMQSQGKKPGWALSGAIVEAPDGLVFFKCVGPQATIQKAQGDIDAMIKSVVKVGAAKA